jgi:DNA-binding beta-propeller fold protein YncE
VPPTATPTATPTPVRFQGSFVTKWGTEGNGNGQFKYPTDIAVDNGSVYVTDGDNHRVQKFTSSGEFLTQWQHLNATGIATGPSGDVYVLGAVATWKVTKYSSSGTLLLNWGETGNGNGQFWSPQGIAVDGERNVYVVDHDNHRVQKFR